MKFDDRLKSLTSSIDPGAPLIRLKMSSDLKTIRAESMPWFPPADDPSFLGRLITECVRRTQTINGYAIDYAATKSNITESVVDNFSHLYTRVSTNKEPTRTKTFKAIKQLQRKARREEDIFEDFFAIAEYNDQVTREDSITSVSNQVHRKNILYLIESLVRKHGSENNN
jgi:hypothetical protein